MDEFPPLYSDWERWAAGVSESHANYPGLDLVPLTGLHPQLARRPGGHDGLGGAVPRRQSLSRRPVRLGSACPWASTACAPWRVPCASPTTRTRCPTAGIRLVAPGVRRGVPPAGVGRLPRSSARGGCLAPLPGLAGQLRSHRRRVGDDGRAAARAMVLGPPRARHGQAPAGAQPDPRRARGGSVVRVNKTFKTPSDRESNNS